MTEVADPSKRMLIVIVNYKTTDVLIDCLLTLEPEIAANPSVRVIIVDNASPDDSVDRLTRCIDDNAWAGWIDLRRLERNVGFAGGCNAAMRDDLASDDPADYYFLLNPDTLVDPGVIAKQLAFMDAHPDVGVLGVRVEDPDGNLLNVRHRFPHPLSMLATGARLGVLARLMAPLMDQPVNGDEPQPSGWVSGSSILIRREVLHEVGLLDEAYFLYFDEVDFCYRVHQTDWQVYYLPTARVVHLEGAATNINAPRQRRGQWWYDSRRRFMIKAYGVTGLIVGDVLWAIGRLILVCRVALGLGGNISRDPRWYAWDLLWGDARAVLTLRAFRLEPQRIR